MFKKISLICAILMVLTFAGCSSTSSYTEEGSEDLDGITVTVTITDDEGTEIVSGNVNIQAEEPNAGIALVQICADNDISYSEMGGYYCDFDGIAVLEGYQWMLYLNDEAQSSYCADDISVEDGDTVACVYELVTDYSGSDEYSEM